MAFTIRDFRNLVQLMEQHPEWRAEVRRVVLTDDILALPATLDRVARLVEELARAQAQAEKRLVGVEDRLQRVEARLAGVEDRLTRLEATVERLVDAQLRTEQRLATLVDRFDSHERRNALDMQLLKDGQLTSLLISSPRYLRLVVDRPRILDSTEVELLVDSLLAQQKIGPEQLRDLFRADLLVHGEREGIDGYLVVEASWTIGPKDIDRARRRAAVLERGRLRAWPAVAGYRLSEDAERDPRLDQILRLMLEE